MSKILSRVGWLVLAVAAIGLTAYIVSLRKQEREWKSRTAELRQREKELKAEMKRGVALMWEARGWRNSEYSTDRKLQEMLRQCTSRDDFIVREGPRIAWSKLADTDGMHKIAFYLPEGKHRLRGALYSGVYVGTEVPSPFALSRKPVELSRRVRTDTTVTCELGPQAEVYELQFWWDIGAGLPRVRLLGKENAIAREESLLGMDGPRYTRLKVRGTGLAYPSELKYDDDTRRWQTILSRPVTELAHFEFPGGPTAWELRWWIESDAPPCVSAVEAAANYDMLGRMLTSADPYRRLQTSERAECDAAFVRTFKPYDGSDRLYFRDGVIPSLQTLQPGVEKQHVP
jgi:hypothetical protein